MTATLTRPRSGIVTDGARAVAEARQRTAAKPQAPTREDLQGQLDRVRDEQRALWRVQKSTGLTAKDHARTAELGRDELRLMAELREMGKRKLGAPHKRR